VNDGAPVVSEALVRHLAAAPFVNRKLSRLNLQELKESGYCELPHDLNAGMNRKDVVILCSVV